MATLMIPGSGQVVGKPVLVAILERSPGIDGLASLTPTRQTSS